MSSSNVSSTCAVVDDLCNAVVERGIDLRDILGDGATANDFCEVTKGVA